MELSVRLPTGESVPVAVATDATVGDVKQALQDIKGVSPVHQKMSLSGKRLKDRAVLAEAGLSNGDEVDVRVGLNGGCSCCVNLCKALLILILFPFILLIMLFGILLWVLFLPFYLIAKCCCEVGCCCIVCVEEHVVGKCICLPCRACEWICEDVADAGS